MTINTTTHYHTLEVSQDANKENIKKAYRLLSKIHHPDAPTGDEETFKIIKDAYEILIDDNARAVYDNQLKSGTSSNGGKPEFTGKTQDTYSDIFSARKDRNAPQRGKNRYADVTITFEESVQGVRKDVPLRVHKICTACEGKGKLTTQEVAPCSSCKGTRKVVTQVENMFGHTVSNTRICPDCRDTKVEEIFCPDCKGQGAFTSILSVPVEIEAGIENNERLRVKGFGEDGINGGMTGDLIVTVSVEESQFFERKGNDLYMPLLVSFTDLVLGNTITIQTLEGEMSIKIPKGTEPNTEFRIKGKGVADIANAFKGDMVVTAKLQIPTNLTEDQEELLKSIGL